VDATSFDVKACTETAPHPEDVAAQDALSTLPVEDVTGDAVEATRGNDSASPASDKTALIISTKVRDTVVYYGITSTLAPEQSTSWKRYSDFVALEKTLSAEGRVSTSKLPRKEIVGLRKKVAPQAFLQKRQASLQSFLDHITQQAAAHNDADVLQFLRDD
jgi:hypothetical protein